MIRLELSIQLHYEIEDPRGADLIFNIHAAQTGCQTVESERLQLNQPVVPVLATDPATESRFMRVHAAPGPLQVNYDAVVCIRHHRADPDSLAETPIQALPLALMSYLYPSRYCQSDRLLQLAADEFGGLFPGYSRVLAIQHWVQRQVRFVSNSSNSTTSAVDTLIERVGVCRDFAHLMIALCRALNIPARIVSGTDYGADPALGPPDFHAYVEVYLGERWYLFDPSGTGIPMGFMRLGTGRDAADVAFASMFGRVQASAPRITTQPIVGSDSEMPVHCREALSTTEPGSGSAGDAAAQLQAHPPGSSSVLPTRQLPR